MNFLNLRESSFYPFFKKYSDIVVEEVSDRVVINVLDGVQKEVNAGSDLTKELVSKVIRPNHERIANYSVQRIQLLTQQILLNHQEDIKAYLFEKVNAAVEMNTEMKMIKRVPGLGGIVRKQLDSAIADITYKVISGILEDVAVGEDVFTKELEGISMNFINTLESDEELEEIVKTISNQSINMIKRQMERQNWKENSLS
jgi:hypothetical protein